MKSKISLLIFLLLSLYGLAQENPRSTQYIFNNYLFNPAITGIDNYTDLKLGYRSQWRGLEGATNGSFCICFNLYPDPVF